MDNLKAFIKAAEAVYRECKETPYEVCNNNKCKFVTKDGHCIFDEMYMNPPVNWELDIGNDFTKEA